jgi:hypothetical protein
MENIMKKILTLSLILASMMPYAEEVNLNPLFSPSAVVVQKALASGVTFTTNQVQYQLVLGGRAFAKSDNSVAARSSTSNLWSDEHGPFMVSIDAGGQSANSSLRTNGVNFMQLAFNPDSGKVAVITGVVIVKIRPTYSAETIASTYSINLVQNFEDISYAFYQVNSGQDIFAIAQNLSGHPGVASAEIEAVENFVTPR